MIARSASFGACSVPLSYTLTSVFDGLVALVEEREDDNSPYSRHVVSHYALKTRHDGGSSDIM